MLCIRIKDKVFIVFFVLVWLATGENASSAPLTLESLFSKMGSPKGWTLIEGPKFYTRKTLFQRIDGQAELFFKYGFQKSVFGMYQDQKKPEHQVELDLYDMGNVLQAFGIFSRSRHEDRPMGIGLDSHLQEGSAFFYQGKYFVMLYSTEADAAALKQFATKISMSISDSSSPPKEIGYFPEKGLKPGSILYFSEALMGHRFLGRGFQGTYREKVEEFQIFLAIFKDSSHGRGALKAYRDYLSMKGRLDPEIPATLGSEAFKGEDPYQGRIMVTLKGIYLLGAVGFQKAEEGERHLTEFLKRVK